MNNYKIKMKKKEYYEDFYHKSNKEIAKEIRKVLKETFWKDFKFSVTTDRNAINMEILEWPIDFYTKEYLEAEKNKDWDTMQKLKEKEWKTFFKMNDDKIYKEHTYYTEKWREILDLVEKIHELYNYDKSDSMTDYFDVNYYWQVRIWKWNKAYIKKD